MIRCASRSIGYGTIDREHEVFVTNFQDVRVTVMGLGHFGGGVGAVQYLLQQGARVTVTDLQTAEQLDDSLSRIDTASLAGLVLGQHREEDFTQTDLVVASPAVPPNNRFLQAARDAGIPVTSEMALFWERCQARKLVVTGSTGKSTTATLIRDCLAAAGWSVELGGNIGRSLLPQVASFTPDDWVILELSSFQLASLDALKPQPDLTVVTNLFPNHLDWHGSFESYEAAKQTACAWQTTSNIAVLNADDPLLPLWPTDARVIWFGRECWRDRPGVVIEDQHLVVRTAQGGWKIELSDLAPALQTAHGLKDVAAALATVLVGLQVPIEKIVEPLKTFPGLPHRFQSIGTRSGRQFINDSKATVPESSISALESISAPIYLIAGGKDKGLELTEFARCIHSRVKGVALIGETAPRLKQLLIEESRSARQSGQNPRRSARDEALDWIELAPSLAEAMQWICSRSEPGDVVLLSPGCASQGEFINFEDRGNRFRELAETFGESETENPGPFKSSGDAVNR